jgi:hypothetical protein
MSLIYYPGKRNLVGRGIVLQAPVYGRCVHICLVIQSAAIRNSIALTGYLVFGEEGTRSSALPFASRSFGHCDFEEQVVRPHRRRQQALGKGVVWTQRDRYEFLELIVALGIGRGFQS